MRKWDLSGKMGRGQRIPIKIVPLMMGRCCGRSQAQVAVPSLRPRPRKVEKKVDEEASISVDTCGRVFLDAKAYHHLLFPGIQLDVRMDASWMPCVFVRKVVQGAGSACIVKYQGKDRGDASMRTVDLETIRIPVAPPPLSCP